MTSPALRLAEARGRAARKDQDVRTAEARTASACRAKWSAERTAVLAALEPWAERIDSHAADMAEAASPLLQPHVRLAAERRLVLAERLRLGDLVAALGKAVGTGSAELAEALDDEYPRVYLRGADSALADGKLDMTPFTLENPRAVRWLRSRGADRVRGIDTTTRGYLRTVLTNATSEGWSYARTARVISARYSTFSKRQPQRHVRSRAELVAITEMGDAYEAGRQHFMAEAEAELDVTWELRWLTAADDRVCPVCGPNGQAGWVVRGTAFPSGHLHPLAHPACRCDVQARPVG